MADLPMIVDCFAGGGGASTGIELALGRSPDLAINHSAAALALHAANHPDTLHLDSNIWDVDPLTVTGGRKVGLLWASPDCKHFSKAKGAAVRDRNIRDLAWVVVRWARWAKPDVILLENVEEFITWGPVGEDGQPIKEFAGQTFERWVRQLRALGYRVQWRELRACDYGAPTIRKRLFIVARRDGRPIVWPKPTHGDPKSPDVRRGKLLPWRTAAECIDWSLPCPSIFDTSAQIMARHGLRAVRPLAANTLARVARGMARYVLGAERPFVVNTANGKTTGRGPNAWTADEPLRTITSAPGFACVSPALATFYGHGDGRGTRAADIDSPLRTVTVENRHALISPYLASIAHGDSGGRREYPVADPLGTVTVGGIQHALIAPVLTYAQHGGSNRPADNPAHTVTASRKDQNAVMLAGLVQTGYGERPGQAPRALDPGAPLGTVVAGGVKHAPFAAFLAQQNGGPAMDRHAGRPAAAPLSTVTASGSQQTPVAAFFAKYYGTGDGARTDDPLHTITVKDRMGHIQADLAAPPFTEVHHDRARQVAAFLRDHGAWDGGEFVTLSIDGAEFVVIDIGLRMLTPRELFNAQGFPPDYVIEGVWEGDEPQWRPFPAHVQVSCCGNSVCPPVAEALARANCGHLASDQCGDRAQQEARA